MRQLMAGVLVAAMAIGFSACGGSNKDEQAASEAAAEAQRAAGAQGDAAQALGDAAKGLEQMTKAMQQGAGGSTVEPVDFKALVALLPQVPGWAMGPTEGQRVASPVAVSQASATYSKGEASVEARIVDSGLNQLFFAPMMMFMANGYERQTDDGYEKATMINGNPGWERWDGTDKEGELNMVVGKRFLVTFQGTGLPDAKALQEFMNRTDAGKLAGLK